MNKEDIVDLRTDLEKAREARYVEIGERFKELLMMPFATPTRVMRYLAKETGLTYLTVRLNLIRLGYYTPKKHDDGRAESGK